jgi:hypothetical protein
MTNKTHWKMLINPDYIGAYALPPGQDLTVTIESVSREIVTSTGGKKEECTVARLKGHKPLILNVTNSKSIARLYGPYIEDWAGKPITLYASTTKLAGEMVECVRIRPQVVQQQPQKQPLSDERLDKAIESIKAGEFYLDQLHARFDLTPDQVQKVNQQVAQ